MIERIRLQMLRYQTLSAYRRERWDRIPIIDCGERLVAVPADMSEPYYLKQRLSQDATIYLREGVLDRLMTAHRTLQRDGLGLRVYDGWRSPELQEELFWYYLRSSSAEELGFGPHFRGTNNQADIRARFDELTPDAQIFLRAHTRTYVGERLLNPLTAGSHQTGGAVGVWVMEGGSAANLGVHFNEMVLEAGAFYHLKFSRVLRMSRRRFVGNDKRVRWIRERLILGMTSSGFSCYGPLIWHFNSGNQMDALVVGGKARYGRTEP